jgi:hypothetical protein
VGPEQGRSEKIVPMIHELPDVCEVSGVGTLFPDKDGNPLVFDDMACGRND